VQGSGFRVEGGKGRVNLVGFGIWYSGFGFWVSGFKFRVSGFEFRVSGFGFRITGFGFSVQDLQGRNLKKIKGQLTFLPKKQFRIDSLSTRWSTTLSSEVNMPPVIHCRALCGANLVA